MFYLKNGVSDTPFTLKLCHLKFKNKFYSK